jgi:putative ABC transport system permease protein
MAARVRSSPNALRALRLASAFTRCARCRGHRRELGQGRLCRQLFRRCRLASLLWLAAIIAIVIAAFGTYVLAADAVERRTGEIALRRLFGARRRDFCKLIAGEIGSIVLVSAAVSLPLAALAIARYLAPFTERTPSAFWTLALATVAALAIASLASARHAWIAMSLKPAVALRT